MDRDRRVAEIQCERQYRRYLHARIPSRVVRWRGYVPRRFRHSEHLRPHFHPQYRRLAELDDGHEDRCESQRRTAGVDGPLRRRRHRRCDRKPELDTRDAAVAHHHRRHRHPLSPRCRGRCRLKTSTQALRTSPTWTTHRAMPAGSIAPRMWTSRARRIPAVVTTSAGPSRVSGSALHGERHHGRHV